VTGPFNVDGLPQGHKKGAAEMTVPLLVMTFRIWSPGCRDGAGRGRRLLHPAFSV